MIAIYFIALSIAIFAIGVSGVAASRHFLMAGLSIEVMLLASTLLAVTLFYYYSSASSVISLLLSLWSVAAAETMAFMVLYRYLVKWNLGMDITKLSKLRH
jgi:NADH:ubiquinone oxidoreductase subunit K